MPTDVPSPPVATGYNVASAKEFAKYVLGLVIPSLGRRDLSPVLDLLAPGAHCNGCKDNVKRISQLRKQHEYIVTPRPTVTIAMVAGHVGNRYAIGLTYNLGKGKGYSDAGKYVAVIDRQIDSYIEVGMEWNEKASKWMLLDYAITEGGSKP